MLLLRRQLAIFERKQTRPVRFMRGERLLLVVVAKQLKSKTGRTIKEMGGGHTDRETSDGLRLAPSVGTPQVDLPATETR